MASPWPATLQQKLNEANYAQSPQSRVITTDMDISIPKKRVRYTKGLKDLTGSIDVNTSEYSIFETFFETTLAGGSLPFLFNDPVTQVEYEYRFKDSTYSEASLGGGYFRLSFTWERLP